jgi:pimeloyl-ACP methyl ester carboxylesterase
MGLVVSRSTGPVVVMESGGGSTHAAWAAVVPELAKVARVVTYDRAGYGLSAACDKPRTAERMAAELREALRAARIDPPYTLVGWSLGGVLVRVFGGLYPQDTQGLVLVDPAPEGFYARMAREYPDLYSAMEESRMKELFANGKRVAEARETAAWTSSMEQAKQSDSRHMTPTVLLIAAGGKDRNQEDPIWKIWAGELKSWASQRPSVGSIRLVDSGHHIAREKPDIVIEAVRSMLDRVKK